MASKLLRESREQIAQSLHVSNRVFAICLVFQAVAFIALLLLSDPPEVKADLEEYGMGNLQQRFSESLLAVVPWAQRRLSGFSKVVFIVSDIYQ